MNVYFNPYVIEGGVSTILQISRSYDAPIVENIPMGPIALEVADGLCLEVEQLKELYTKRE